MRIKTVTIDADEEAVLRQAKLDGNKLILQGQLDRAMYQRVNKVLELIGFKWNKSSKCHVGEGDSADKLREALSGGKVVDEKQSFQFFETPENLAERMVAMANMSAKHTVLEPSAGKGAIIKAIQRSYPGITVFACELNPKMSDELTKMARVAVLGRDFMDVTTKFDRIIMNPPFNVGQDIQHVRHAYDLLNTGGRIVAITSRSWIAGNNKKTEAFRNWLDGLVSSGNASIQTIEEGSFKDSGTMVGTMLLTICKPAA